jgi:hypothetical protein
MADDTLSRVWQRYKPIIVLAIFAGAGYGLYILYRYIEVERDLGKRSASIVQPKVDEDSVSEIGYIYSMRDELFLKEDNTINLVWFIKIPATGERYSCSWERGFSEFRTGDDVRLIRPRDVSMEAGDGYIVGLHDRRTGKASLVWVIDVESLELDLGPDE